MFDAPPIERAPAPVVSGDTRCPRPAEVAAALGRMLTADAPASPTDEAELEEDAGDLVIVVRRPSGEIVGERRLSATLSCAVRAEAAAVAIAALEARAAAGDGPPLSVPRLPTPPVVLAVPAAPAITAPTLSNPLVTVARAPEHVAAPAVIDVGAALIASANGTSAGATPRAVAPM